MKKDNDIVDEVCNLLMSDTVYEFFHTQDKVAYIVISSSSNQIVMKVDSESCADQIRLLAFEQLGTHLKRAALKEVQSIIKSYAKINCPCEEISMRYENSSGNVYVHRGILDGGIVKISPDGYKILKSSGIRFYSPQGQKQLPRPKEGGSFKEFREMFRNISLKDFKLVVSWMICVIHSKGPFPILVFQGEQGSAKTIFMKMVRDLLDPMLGSLISIPNSERDLVITAQNNIVLAFDNVSSLSKGMPDSLCRLATGAGLRTRALYTDSDEKVFESCRPIMINGIPNFVLKSDLADRVLLIHLSTINEGDRRTEAEVWDKYLDMKPRILGSLYNAVSTALTNLDSVVLDSHPRMADFARLSCAAAPSLKWTQDKFLAAYEDNRNSLINVVFSGDKVTEAIRDFVVFKLEWEGSSSDLLKELELVSGNEELIKKRFWPGSASALGSKILQTAPVLRTMGIGHKYKRKNSKRIHKFWTLDN